VAASRTDWLGDVLADARSASSATGVPAVVILTQWGVETGFGTSRAWLEGHNYGGVSPGGRLAYYPSRTEGLAAYVRTLNLGYYAGVRAAGRAGDVTGTLDALAASPWAGGHYADRGGVAGASLRAAYPAVASFLSSSGSSDIVPAIGPPTLNIPGVPFPVPNPTELPDWLGGAVGDAVGGAASNVAEAIGDAVGKALGGLVKPFARVAFSGLFVAAGLGLIVLGSWRAVGKPVREAVDARMGEAIGGGAT
jgi:hypothetical protein